MATPEAIAGDINSQELNDWLSYLDSEKVGIGIFPFRNVKYGGAVGDGMASDSPAFQAYLDEAKTQNNKVSILVPDGKYRMTETLRIYENTRLIISANAEIIRDHPYNMILNGDDGASYTGYDGNGNIIIEGGLWDASMMEGTSGMGIMHGHDVIVRNLKIKDIAGGHAIEINASRDCRVYGCQFLGFYDTGGRDYSGAINIDLAKNESVFHQFGAYDNTTCMNVTVRDCYFGKSENFGAWPRGVESHSSTNGFWHNNVMVTDCIFDSTLQWGIRAETWDNATLSGNIFNFCGGGIAFDPPGSQTTDANGNVVGSQYVNTAIISGNQFNGCGGYGSVISVSGLTDGHVTDITISTNTIRSSAAGTLGIYASYADRISITGNVIKDNQTTAISINDSTIATTTGNVIEGVSGGSGITNNRTNVVTCVGNSINSVDEYGILINGGLFNATVSGNTLVGISNDGTREPIRVVSDVNQFTVTGNTASNASGYTARYGIYVSGTCRDGMIDGNNVAYLGIQVDAGATNVVKGTNLE